MRNQGRPDDFFDGRPVIGVCNTWSDLTPCNGHFRELAEKVKIGIYEAGGVPVVMKRLEKHLHRDVSDEELAERKTHWRAPEIPEGEKRGYAHLYRTHVTQADTGADFDFLIGSSSAKLPKSSH